MGSTLKCVFFQGWAVCASILQQEPVCICRVIHWLRVLEKTRRNFCNSGEGEGGGRESFSLVFHLSSKKVEERWWKSLWEHGLLLEERVVEGISALWGFFVGGEGLHLLLSFLLPMHWTYGHILGWPLLPVIVSNGQAFPSGGSASVAVWKSFMCSRMPGRDGRFQMLVCQLPGASGWAKNMEPILFWKGKVRETCSTSWDVICHWVSIPESWAFASSFSICPWWLSLPPVGASSRV